MTQLFFVMILVAIVAGRDSEKKSRLQVDQVDEDHPTRHVAKSVDTLQLRSLSGVVSINANSPAESSYLGSLSGFLAVGTLNSRVRLTAVQSSDTAEGVQRDRWLNFCVRKSSNHAAEN